MIRSVLLFLLITIPVAAQTPAAIERELKGYLKTMAESGTYSGDYDETKLNPASSALKRKLMRYATRADVLSYAFPKLKDEMFIATSKDGNLRIYSWDLETGGTMHDFASVFQYRTNDGRVRVWSESSDDESAGPFYTQIFQVGGPANRFYLANSTFIASSSLSGQAIKAMRIVGDKLDLNYKVIKTASGLTDRIDFAYDFFSVVDHPERPIKLFQFNEARNEFRFPVVIEDEETRLGRVTDKHITYRFNGTHFVKVN